MEHTVVISHFNGDGQYDVDWKKEFCDRLLNVADISWFSEMKTTDFEHPNFDKISLQPDKTGKSKRGMLVLFRREKFYIKTDDSETDDSKYPIENIETIRCPPNKHCQHPIEYISFILTIKEKRYLLINAYHTAERINGRMCHIKKACRTGIKNFLNDFNDKQFDYAIFFGDINLSRQVHLLAKELEEIHYYNNNAFFPTNFFPKKGMVTGTDGHTLRGKTQSDVIFVYGKPPNTTCQNVHIHRPINGFSLVHPDAHPENTKFHAALLFELGDVSHFTTLVCTEDVCDPMKGTCNPMIALTEQMGKISLTVTKSSKK